MVRTDLHSPVGEGESLYTGITTWAAHASRWILLPAAVAGFGLGAALLAGGWERIPAAGLPLAVGSIGAWGLIEQRRTRRHPRGRVALQWALVWLGVTGAIAAGLGILLWMMGPAPIL